MGGPEQQDSDAEVDGSWLQRCLRRREAESKPIDLESLDSEFDFVRFNPKIYQPGSPICSLLRLMGKMISCLLSTGCISEDLSTELSHASPGWQKRAEQVLRSFQSAWMIAQAQGAAKEKEQFDESLEGDLDLVIEAVFGEQLDIAEYGESDESHFQRHVKKLLAFAPGDPARQLELIRRLGEVLRWELRVEMGTLEMARRLRRGDSSIRDLLRTEMIRIKESSTPERPQDEVATKQRGAENDQEKAANGK